MAGRTRSTSRIGSAIHPEPKRKENWVFDRPVERGGGNGRNISLKKNTNVRMGGRKGIEKRGGDIHLTAAELLNKNDDW